MSLTDQDIQTIDKKLHEEEKKLKDQIAELTSQDPFSNPDRLTDNAASDTDAKEESVHDQYQALVSELQGRLDNVTAARKRIADDAYGRCQQCNKPIESNRLLALPYAKLCVTCSESEQK